jgi:hypothetical protein
MGSQASHAGGRIIGGSKWRGKATTARQSAGAAAIQEEKWTENFIFIF